MLFCDSCAFSWYIIVMTGQLQWNPTRICSLALFWFLRLSLFLYHLSKRYRGIQAAAANDGVWREMGSNEWSKRAALIHPTKKGFQHTLGIFKDNWHLLCCCFCWSLSHSRSFPCELRIIFLIAADSLHSDDQKQGHFGPVHTLRLSWTKDQKLALQIQMSSHSGNASDR